MNNFERSYEQLMSSLPDDPNEAAAKLMTFYYDLIEKRRAKAVALDEPPHFGTIYSDNWGGQVFHVQGAQETEIQEITDLLPLVAKQIVARLQQLPIVSSEASDDKR